MEDNQFYLILGSALIALFYGIFREYKKHKKTSDLLNQARAQSNLDKFRILPFDVSEIGIELTPEKKFLLEFTPCSIQQFHGNVYCIKVKASNKKDKIGFSIILYSSSSINLKVNNQEETSHGVIVFDTNSKESDGLIRLLANLFQVEVGNKTQMAKEVIF